MGFKVFINGELAKEFDGDHELVSSVSLRSAQGEAGLLKVPNDVDQVNLVVEVRDPKVTTYLDLQAIQELKDLSEARENPPVVEEPAPAPVEEVAPAEEAAPAENKVNL
jgi:hypothetical protein